MLVDDEARHQRDASERWFRAMADAAPVPMWVAGADARCEFVNQPWLAFTGRTFSAELGDGWSEGVHRDDRSRCLDTYLAAFARREAFELEYRLRRHDGEYRWVLDHGVARRGPDGAFLGYVGSCVDITERRLFERQVLEACEQMRTRIGQDLHDGIGQLLTGIAFLAKSLDGGDMAPATTGRLVALANEAVAQVKTLARGLSPLHAEHHTLVNLLGELALDTAQLYRIDCRFCAESGDLAVTDPSPVTRTQLFMIAREAIANAVRHGQARWLELRLARGDRGHELSIADDGAGFVPGAAPQGLGLRSMRHRAQAIGGTLEVLPRHPRGMIVRCRF